MFVIEPEAVIPALTTLTNPPAFLPNTDTILFRQIKRVLFCHAKCFIPGIKVSQDAIGAKLTWTMSVGKRVHSYGIIGHQITPQLRVAHKEALIARKTIQYGWFAV